MNALWCIGGLVVGALLGASAVLYFILTIPGNFAQMLHQTPKE